MSGYSTNGSMGDVLEALRDKMLQTSEMPYLREVKIKQGPWFFPPLTNYQVYLEPDGSPETIVGEHDPFWIKYATHIVLVKLIVPWQSPDQEDAIIGLTGSNTGLTGFVEDVCQYLENNLLGLSGLESKYPPTIEAPEGAYQAEELEDQVYIRTCTLRWEGRTTPYQRPTDT